MEDENNLIAVKLEAADKRVHNKSFENNIIKREVSCLHQEVQAAKQENNKPASAPEPAKEPVKGLSSYSPFLATFAVAAVAFFIGRHYLAGADPTQGVHRALGWMTAIQSGMVPNL